MQMSPYVSLSLLHYFAVLLSSTSVDNQDADVAVSFLYDNFRKEAAVCSRKVFA